jgi:hypothetical protein
LPALTKAGWRIVAGTSVDPIQADGPVITGDASVEFRAPQIDLLPGFTAGSGFVAVSDVETCLYDCDDCCENWAGFTIDTFEDGNLANWFEPDGDGYMDYWHILDVDHPYCAYGALAYELRIWNAAAGWSNPVWYMAEGNTGCCPFESRSPNNQIPHSSIYWDGTVNAGMWNNQGGQVQLDNDYAYELKLFGCGGSEMVFTGLVRPFSNANMGLQPDSLHAMEPVLSQYEADSSATDHLGLGLPMTDANRAIRIFPNPLRDILTVQAPFPIVSLSLLDGSGREQVYLATNDRTSVTLDLPGITAGVYVLRVNATDATYHHRIVKQ